MPRGVPHPPELRAQAIAAVAGGESAHAVARRLGIAYQTVQRWYLEDGPIQRPYARTREALAELIFDTVVETLNALRVRARVTGCEDWIKEQPAAELAALDAAQWDRIIRVISGFRPVEQEPPALPE